MFSPQAENLWEMDVLPLKPEHRVEDDFSLIVSVEGMLLLRA